MRDRRKMHPHARAWTERIRKSLPARPANPSRPARAGPHRGVIPRRVKQMRHIDRTIVGARAIPRVWRPWFRDTSTWAPWFMLLRLLVGLPIGGVGALLPVPGLRAVAEDGVGKAWLTCGRRAGKSFMLALIAAYLAIFRTGAALLAPVPLWPAQVI
jgi:hypothetical protein